MTIRRFLGISLLAVVAGCNQTDKPADLGVTSDPSGVQAAAQQQTQVAVIQGSCPQVFLRDGTAVLQRFGKGAKDDPQNLAYQVTLADTTRQCVMSNDQLVMTVVVQGRIVVGPAGASGTVTVPIRVSVMDGDTAIRRPVRLGVSSLGEVEILSGLRPGDRVVVSGADLFGDAESVSIN